MADTISGDTSSITTLSVNSSAMSAIDFLGDTDWWRVTLAVGYGYQVWVEGSTYSNGTLVDPYLAIYNSAGTLQLYNDDYSVLTFDSYLYAIPSSTGTFYLSAEEFGNNGTGTYTITLLQDELATISTAASVTPNASVTGGIGWQGDSADWYAVNLTAGIQYQFDLIGSSNDGALSGLTLVDPWLALRDATGTAVLVNDDSGLGLNSRIFFTPSTSGTYYLDAQESGVDASGIYSLVVNSTPTAGALTLGTPLAGSVDFAGGVDLLSVSLTAGVAYAFALDGSTLIDPYLEVLDSTGATLYSDDDTGAGLNAYLTFTPTTSGTYFLAARASGNNATGSYSASVYELPSVSIADASVVEGDSGTTNLVFTLTLSSVSTVPVSVTASTSGTSTAIVGVDYNAAFSTVSFAAGQTTATFTVQVSGDISFEPTEAFYVNLSSPQGIVLWDSSAWGSIVDNDSPYANLPTDPYRQFQWYLYDNTGIDVFRVWDDYTGAGVRVAVFDQGIDPNHSDLDGNLLTDLGRNAADSSAGGAPILSSDNHGTAVAGTISAERDGTGIVGVAYDADLVSIYSPLTLAGLPAQIANAYTYAVNFDVLNDSWGFANGFSSGDTWAFYDNFQSPTFSADGTALASLAANGRGGLGTVVVQSAGNSFSLGDDTNLHNFQNSQYIITVAATDYSGNVTSYSSPGASVLVAAPGGGGGSGTAVLSDIVTTDRVGSAGYDPSNYTTIAGTSFSAPITSGVVALMLEANPNLGYRDVQEILAYSARLTSTAQNTWDYNGATNWNGGGLHYDALSHDLGYGLIDATAAVRLAETWGNSSHTAANRQQVSITHSPALAIPDNSFSGAFDSISVSQAIDVERVEVTLNVTHPYVGDLSVLLTSPSGTTSFLLWRPQQNPLSAYGTSQNDIHFTFDTVLDWGESSAGSWGLSIYDNAAGDVGSFDSWTLNLIGKSASADDCYIYTDEFAESRVDQSVRGTLTDSDGIDTLNAAAVTGNLILDLSGATASIIDSATLTIAAGTVIENAYGGDGNDTIIGNDTANTISSMRGSDILIGGGGADTLTGGTGTDTFCYLLASDSTVLAFDTIKDFVSGDKIEYTGITGINLNSEVIFWAGSINLTVAAVEANSNLYNTLNYFTDGLNGYLYLNGAGTGVNFDNTLVCVANSNTILSLNDFIGITNIGQLINGTAGNDTLQGSVNDDTINGLAGADTITAIGGNDTIDSGDGNDNVNGGSGNDSILGGLGDDTIDGAVGADTLAGGAGNDTYIVDDVGDVVIEQANGGNDTIQTTFAAYELNNELENLILSGTAVYQVGKGNAADNNIYGSIYNDHLFGGQGNDNIFGNTGQDHLEGGAGADIFAYLSVNESTPTGMDRIVDFVSGLDKIDLSAIDANTDIIGNQAFTYIGNTAFNGTAGELRYSDWKLSGDTNGDGAADFMVKLPGVETVLSSDLIFIV